MTLLQTIVMHPPKPRPMHPAHPYKKKPCPPGQAPCAIPLTDGIYLLIIFAVYLAWKKLRA